MIMEGLDVARNAIGEFRFPEFRLLRKLRVSAMPAHGQSIINIELALETDSRQPPARLCMRFRAVSSLQVRDLGGEARIPGFDVADLSDRHLERINWQVFDFEESVISFYAEDAEIVAASVLKSC